MFRSLRHNNGGAGGAVCWLFNPRAFYRWVQCPIDKGHGGGGGLNKVTENEIRRVIRIAERFPQFRCRRIAYSLERAGVVYISKTRIAQNEDLVSKIWLLGPSDKVERLQRSSKYPKDMRVLNARDGVPDLALQTKSELFRHAKLRGKTLDEGLANTLSENPLYQGAWLVKTGLADAGLAGAVYSTAEVIRAGLAVIGLQEGIRSVSSSFLMHRPGVIPLLWLYTDCGVIIEPTSEQLADIAATSIDTWRRISKEEPIVAFLSYSTKGSAKHVSQEKVASGFELFKARYPDVLSDGELQFDAAFDAAVGLRKAPQSKVPGRANIFVFPNLDAGNIAYKISLLPSSKSNQRGKFQSTTQKT